MEEKKKICFKSGVILIAGSVLTIFWMYGLPLFFYKWWQEVTFLPDKIYFPIEEFLALNNHPNSPWITIGGFLIIITTILLSWKLNGRPKKRYELALLPIVILLLAGIMFPCLCRPLEYSRRARCAAQLKTSFLELKLYAEENNCFQLPETVSLPECKHKVNYYGKGRSLKSKPFVLFEDAERCHAGDLRHIILSDGTMKLFYPWKDK